MCLVENTDNDNDYNFEEKNSDGIFCSIENTDDQNVECYLPSVSGLICRIEPEYEDVCEGVFFVLFYNLHCLCPFAFDREHLNEDVSEGVFFVLFLFCIVFVFSLLTGNI